MGPMMRTRQRRRSPRSTSRGFASAPPDALAPFAPAAPSARRALLSMSCAMAASALLARERDRHERRELALGAQHPHEQLVQEGSSEKYERARALVARARGERVERARQLVERGDLRVAALGRRGVRLPRELHRERARARGSPTTSASCGSSRSTSARCRSRGTSAAVSTSPKLARSRCEPARARSRRTRPPPPRGARARRDVGRRVVQVIEPEVVQVHALEPAVEPDLARDRQRGLVRRDGLVELAEREKAVAEVAGEFASRCLSPISARGSRAIPRTPRPRGPAARGCTARCRGCRDRRPRPRGRPYRG